MMKDFLPLRVSKEKIMRNPQCKIHTEIAGRERGNSRIIYTWYLALG